MARFMIATILQENVESSESSESDDDELFLIMGYRGDRRRIPRIENYVEHVVPEYTDNEFKSNYRMNRKTFEEVLVLLAPSIMRQTDECNPAGRNTIPVEKQVLLALWVFSTPDSYRSLCEKFNVGRATAIRTVRRVTKASCDLAPDIIKWPSVEAAEDSWMEFERRQGFPKILGAIDGTHIPIQAPNENAEAYVNRKGYHSIQLQAICNHRMLFIHCYAGQVGSVHDQRVLRLSDVQEYLSDETKFPNDWPAGPKNL